MEPDNGDFISFLVCDHIVKLTNVVDSSQTYEVRFSNFERAEIYYYDMIPKHKSMWLIQLWKCGEFKRQAIGSF